MLNQRQELGNVLSAEDAFLKISSLKVSKMTLQLPRFTNNVCQTSSETDSVIFLPSELEISVLVKHRKAGVHSTYFQCILQGINFHGCLDVFLSSACLFVGDSSIDVETIR